MQDIQEQKEIKRVDKAFIQDKLNDYGITRKTVISCGALLVCMIFVVILSITQAQFNQALLTDVVFWVKLCVQIGLTIFGIVTGEQSGDDSFRNMKKSFFRKRVNDWSKVYDSIDSQMYFPYFSDWLEGYRQRRLAQKIRHELMQVGIKQPKEVMDLDINEVDNLEHAYKKDWKGTICEGKYNNDVTYFVSCTKDQIETIKACMSGVVKVANLDEDYFKNALGGGNKDMWDSASKQNKKKGLFLGINYGYRIAFMVAMEFALSGLDATKGSEASGKTIALDLASRLFTLCMAFAFGMFIGYEVVKIDAQYISFRTSVLKEFSDEMARGMYNPISIEEQARLEYEREHKNDLIEIKEEKEGNDNGE